MKIFSSRCFLRLKMMYSSVQLRRIYNLSFYVQVCASSNSSCYFHHSGSPSAPLVTTHPLTAVQPSTSTKTKPFKQPPPSPWSCPYRHCGMRRRCQGLGQATPAFILLILHRLMRRRDSSRQLPTSGQSSGTGRLCSTAGRSLRRQSHSLPRGWMPVHFPCAGQL